MPRQNQDHGSYVRGVAGVTPASKGGTGAQTPVEAVDNLNGLHRSTIDQIDGLAMTDADGYLKPEYFGNVDIYVGPRIKGPAVLYKGCAARFQVMNFASEREVQVTIEGYDKELLGYVAQGPFFAFKVPNVEGPLELTINVIYDGVTRQLVLPMESASIGDPVILTKNETTFNGFVWLEIEAPLFNGAAAFDEFVATPSSFFRGNTTTISMDGSGRVEFSHPSGSQRLTSEFPISEIRIAGRLTSPDSYAYAVYDGEYYHLTNVFDEFTIKPKNSLSVDIHTSANEDIWVAFIRPIDGNKAYGTTLYVEAIIEYAESIDGPWTEAIAPFLCRIQDSLSIPIPGIPAGQFYFRIMYRYVAGETELLSPYSEPVHIANIPSGQPQVNTLAAPYLAATTNFGKFITTREIPDGRELYVTGTLEGSGDVVFRYHVTGNAIEYLTDFVTSPSEPTRAPNAGFGDKVLVSEDGRYLFVSAPKASFSDLTGTTGAVYVYERYGDRFTFIKRLTDVNQLNTGFGATMVQAGNTLIIGTESTPTQPSSLNFYLLQDTVSADRFVFQRVEMLDQANQINLTNLIVGRYFDTAVPNVPLLLFGVRFEAASGTFKQFTSKYLLSPADGTMYSIGTNYEGGPVPLFDPNVSKSHYVMTYSGFDGASNEHIGYYHKADGGTRMIYARKWTLSKDGETFTLQPNDYALDNFEVYTNGTEIGGFDVSRDLTQTYVGSSAESVIGYPDGTPVTYVNAGLLYQLYGKVLA